MLQKYLICLAFGVLILFGNILLSQEFDELGYLTELKESISKITEISKILDYFDKEFEKIKKTFPENDKKLALDILEETVKKLSKLNISPKSKLDNKAKNLIYRIDQYRKKIEKELLIPKITEISKKEPLSLNNVDKYITDQLILNNIDKLLALENRNPIITSSLTKLRFEQILSDLDKAFAQKTIPSGKVFSQKIISKTFEKFPEITKVVVSDLLTFAKLFSHEKNVTTAASDEVKLVIPQFENVMAKSYFTGFLATLHKKDLLFYNSLRDINNAFLEKIEQEGLNLDESIISNYKITLEKLIRINKTIKEKKSINNKNEYIEFKDSADKFIDKLLKIFDQFNIQKLVDHKKIEYAKQRNLIKNILGLPKSFTPNQVQVALEHTEPKSGDDLQIQSFLKRMIENLQNNTITLKNISLTADAATISFYFTAYIFGAFQVVKNLTLDQLITGFGETYSEQIIYITALQNAVEERLRRSYSYIDHIIKAMLNNMIQICKNRLVTINEGYQKSFTQLIDKITYMIKDYEKQKEEKEKAEKVPIQSSLIENGAIVPNKVASLLNRGLDKALSVTDQGIKAQEHLLKTISNSLAGSGKSIQEWGSTIKSIPGIALGTAKVIGNILQSKPLKSLQTGLIGQAATAIMGPEKTEVMQNVLSGIKETAQGIVGSQKVMNIVEQIGAGLQTTGQQIVNLSEVPQIIAQNIEQERYKILPEPIYVIKQKEIISKRAPVEAEAPFQKPGLESILELQKKEKQLLEQGKQLKELQDYIKKEKEKLAKTVQPSYYERITQKEINDSLSNFAHLFGKSFAEFYEKFSKESQQKQQEYNKIRQDYLITLGLDPKKASLKQIETALEKKKAEPSLINKTEKLAQVTQEYINLYKELMKRINNFIASTALLANPLDKFVIQADSTAPAIIHDIAASREHAIAYSILLQKTINELEKQLILIKGKSELTKEMLNSIKKMIHGTQVQNFEKYHHFFSELEKIIIENQTKLAKELKDIKGQSTATRNP